MGVGEKWVKYVRVELWERKGCKLRSRWMLMGEDKWQLGEIEIGVGKEVCDVGEKRWEMEEKGVKVGENGW